MKSNKIKQSTAFQQQTTCNYFPLSQSKSGHDPNFIKRFTVQIQSKEVHYSPDPVLSKSGPMLISALRTICPCSGGSDQLIVCPGVSG